MEEDEKERRKRWQRVLKSKETHKVARTVHLAKTPRPPSSSTLQSEQGNGRLNQQPQEPPVAFAGTLQEAVTSGAAGV